MSTATLETKAATTTASRVSGRTVEAIISSSAIDRDGDVLLPSGLDARDFKKNPVVLLGHDRQRLPIGKVERIDRDKHQVRAVVSFPPRPDGHVGDWEPDTVLHLFKEGVLNAFSVGFTIPPGGVRPASREDRKRFGDGARRVVEKWQLLELSVVGIPANPEALATAAAKSLSIERLAVSYLGLLHPVELPGLMEVNLKRPARRPLRRRWSARLKD